MAELDRMAARFVSTRLSADTLRLSEGDRRALVNLIEVDLVMNDIFHRQLWSSDDQLLEQLRRDIMRPGLSRTFDRLEGIPADIQPVFVTADELTRTGQ